MSFRRSHRTAAVVACAAALAAACSSTKSSEEWAAQSAASAKTFGDQVTAGQALYTKHCAECHGAAGEGDKAPRVVGLKDGALPLDPPSDRKFRKQKFVTVADVADFVTRSMPPKTPGSLGHDEYWAILAFDLHANGLDLPQKLTLDVAKATTIPR